MNSVQPIRIGFLLLAVAPILFWMLLGVSWAQQAPVGVPPEKAQQFLDLLSDPQVKTWLEGKIPSAAAEPPAGSPVETISSWEAAIRDRFNGLMGAVPRIPEELASGAAVCLAGRELGQARAGGQHICRSDCRWPRRRVADPEGLCPGTQIRHKRERRTRDPARDRCLADVCLGQRRFIPGIRMAALTA